MTKLNGRKWMDKAFLDPPLTFYTETKWLRPYLCQFEREAFLRTDSHRFYAEAEQAARQNRTVPPNGEFIVHIPFNNDEHIRVLHWLVLSQFLDLSLPFHTMPLPLVEVKMPQDVSFGSQPEALKRDINSVLEYLSDMAIRGSSLRNADDHILILTKQGRDFPHVYKQCERIRVQDYLQRVLMGSEVFKVAASGCVFGTISYFFICGASPLILSLAKTGSQTKSKKNLPTLSPRFLVSENSRFRTIENPVFCTDDSRFLCISENESKTQNSFLTFFDLSRPTKYQNDRITIPSFKSFTFPVLECVSLLCGRNYSDNMVVAGVTPSGVSAWLFESENQTIRRIIVDPDPNPFKLTWISNWRLVLVRQNFDIHIFQNPFEDGEQQFDPISLPDSKRFVPCQGDALVLQTLDCRLILVATLEDPVQSYEIEFDREIAHCAYAKGTFIVSPDPPKSVIIWNLSHLRHPHEVALRKSVIRIHPVGMMENEPQLFALVNDSELSYVDANGRISPVIVKQEEQSYYDPDGYFSFIIDAQRLLVTWFCERAETKDR
jgi:hypothetical protein